MDQQNTADIPSEPLNRITISYQVKGGKPGRVVATLSGPDLPLKTSAAFEIRETTVYVFGRPSTARTYHILSSPKRLLSPVVTGMFSELVRQPAVSGGNINGDIVLVSVFPAVAAKDAIDAVRTALEKAVRLHDIKTSIVVK